MAGTTPVLLSETVAITFTVGIFFGFYLITVSFANRWLIFADEGWRLRKNIHWFMVIITNLIAALSTTKMGLLVYTSMGTMSLTEQGRPKSEIVDPPWVAVVECTVSDFLALLADIVLVYRLWVVHAKRMRIVWFPIFLWVGGVVCTILQIFLQVVHIHDPDFGPYQWTPVNMDVGPGIVLLPFWASTIALNAYCTGILIWQIWTAAKEGENKTTSKQLRFLVRILMESGALYLFISLAHFFAWFGPNNFAIHMLGSINTNVIGVAHNLVITRTARSRAENEENKSAGEMTTMVFNSKLAISVECTRSITTDDQMVYQPQRICNKEAV